MESIDEDRLRCLRSNSNLSLLDDTKAISIPEKNAEKSKANKMKIKLSKM